MLEPNLDLCLLLLSRSWETFHNGQTNRIKQLKIGFFDRTVWKFLLASAYWPLHCSFKMQSCCSQWFSNSCRHIINCRWRDEKKNELLFWNLLRKYTQNPLKQRTYHFQTPEYCWPLLDTCWNYITAVHYVNPCKNICCPLMNLRSFLNSVIQALFAQTSLKKK